MFFLTYFEFADAQHQHKFWTLGAINDVLNAAIECRLLETTHPINLAQCKTVYLDLMKNKGPQILNQLTIPKFAKMFVSMLKLDNLTVSSSAATCPTANSGA